MITGNKKDIAKLLPYVSQRLGTALQYIAETDFTNVKNGEYHVTMPTLMYSIWGKVRKRFIILPRQIHIKS